MGKFKKPTGKRFIRALTKNTYEIKRYCEGSHVFLIHSSNKNSFAVVPNTTKTLKQGLLEGIRKDQLKISMEEFETILRDC